MCNYFYPRREKKVGNKDKFVRAVKWDVSLIAQLYEIQDYRKALSVISCTDFRHKRSIKKNSVALVRERTIPTERPPPVGEVSANFCG